MEKIGWKHATAEAKRHEQLTEIQERARNQNNKVLLIRERRNSQERAREERVQFTLTEKLTSAEERQAQLLSSIQARAKTHNEIVVTRVQTKIEAE